MYIINVKGNVLEIGGGQKPLPFPHINIDLQGKTVHDLETFPYPFKDEEFDMIVGLYVVEHLSWHVMNDFAKEIYRLLKPGGKAIFLVPNTYEQCKKIVEEGINENTIPMLFGGQEFNPRWLGSHKTGFSPEFAKKLFSDFDVNIIAPMPDVILQVENNFYGLYPACKTDMVIELKKKQVERIIKQENKQHRINVLGEEKNALKLIFEGIDRKSWILNQLNINEKIIDIGSANGWIFKDTPFFDRVTFLDIDLYDLPNFIRMDAEWIYDNRFLIPDKSFDVAVLGEILEHVEDPVKVLKGAKRIAKKIIITVPDPANWYREYYPYETLDEAVKRRNMTPEELAKISNPDTKEFFTKDNYLHLFHRRWYTKEMLEKHLREAGIENYEIINLQYSGWSFFCVIAK